DPQDIYARPDNRMVATFLGNPPMNVFQATYMGEGFQVRGQSLPCPTAVQKRVQLASGQTVELGIRPEHIVLVQATHPRGTEDREKASQLTIEVNVVEPLGRETLIRGSLVGSDVPLNVQAPALWRGHRGDRITVQLNLDQLFVFDLTTGNTLYP
ncbi:MAG TPA: TOBE domain-containing protein, partial [Coleofasciculaceae cyanobacterium]